MSAKTVAICEDEEVESPESSVVEASPVASVVSLVVKDGNSTLNIVEPSVVGAVSASFHLMVVTNTDRSVSASVAVVAEMVADSPKSTEYCTDAPVHVDESGCSK